MDLFWSMGGLAGQEAPLVPQVSCARGQPRSFHHSTEKAIFFLNPPNSFSSHNFLDMEHIPKPKHRLGYLGMYQDTYLKELVVFRGS